MSVSALQLSQRHLERARTACKKGQRQLYDRDLSGREYLILPLKYGSMWWEKATIEDLAEIAIR